MDLKNDSNYIYDDKEEEDVVIVSIRCGEVTLIINYFKGYYFKKI